MPVKIIAFIIVKKKHKLLLKNFWEQLLIKLFIDNIFLYRFVKCHRLSSRSFFVRNRQFHVCARCTGLLIGYAISPLFLLFGDVMAKLFIIFSTALILDGTTQLLQLRQSNNVLRFITGLGTGSTSLIFLYVIIRHVLALS
ncbi:DUF2085 domain-containing protein [Acaryochloris marina NIES-2412]|uniref:DUF2085 domain-containing protein n=1 Tax=Acaryochloris marina TaxID=155978 RepID=UPI004058A47F